MANTIPINDLLGDGGLTNVAVLSTDANGNTVLMGSDGVAKDRFPLPLNPNGLDWLTDTISGFDIYEKGFVKRPTIFVDWNASNSLNLGTFKNPYTTPAQVLARTLNQDMKGQVLGIKRGSVLRDETSALGASTLLTVKGYSSDADRPFIICPYGDAEALPIITGERRTGTGTLYPWVNNGGGVWYISVDYCCHVWDLARDDGQKRSPMVSTLVGVTVPGQSYYDFAADRLYFMPWYGEDPNGSGYLINYAFTSMSLHPAKVAAAGNVQCSGLEVRMGRNNSMRVAIETADFATITSLPNWKLYGNKIWASGRDATTANLAANETGLNTSASALVWFGGWTGAVHVPFSGEMAGNEYGESLNNAVEMSGVDSFVIEYNYGHDCGGHTIVELYSSCANTTVRYNYGTRALDTYTMSDGTTAGYLMDPVGGGGVWVGSYKITGEGASTGGQASAVDSGIENITIHHNLLIGTNVGFKIDAGSGHKIQNNTFAFYGDDVRITTPSMFKCAAEIVGHTNFSNNIAYRAAGTVTGGLTCIQTTSATAAIPTGDGNVYRSNGSGGIKWQVNSSNVATSFAAWKAYAGAVAANIDQTLSVGPTSGDLAWDDANHRPGATSTVIGDGVASLGLGTRYRLGNVRDDAAPTAGSEGNG